MITLRPAEKVKSMMIHGFGTMGPTWAITALLADFQVYVFDQLLEQIQKGTAFVKSELQKIEARQLKKGVVASEGMTTRLLRNLVPTSEWALVKELGFLNQPIHLEAIPENMDLKRRFYLELAPQLPDDAVMWSNTSCLDVEKLARAAGASCQERMVGTHGMNPVHLTSVVEVVRHSLVADEVFTWTCEIIRKLDKTPIPTPNVPGFIVNRIYCLTAVAQLGMLARRETDVATMDLAMMKGLGHPQGAFLLLDWINADTMVDVCDELYQATGNPGYLVPNFYRQMKAVGNLGRKSGRGFYDWADPKNPAPVPSDLLTSRISLSEQPFTGVI